MVGFLCVWVERKFMGLGLDGKKISGFVFKFVGWVCVYVCWLGLIDGGGGWIFLCLGRKKIFGFKENFWVWVWVERKFLGLCLSLLVGFVFMFVGWV